MQPQGHVTRIEYQGREIFIIGTAHISKRSVEEVERVIRELRPDTVCVELDQTRYEALVDENRWRKLDVFAVIRQKKVLFLVTSVALAAYQKKMGEKLGVKPGAELLAAVRSAEAVGARVVLADREIQATLKRTWRNLSLWNKLRLSGGLVAVPFSMEELSEDQIEELKDRDTISEVLEELARLMPDIKTPLIDERDRYLMSMIQEAPGPRIVAVVGAGHVNGMLERLGESVDREALSMIPGPSLAWRIAKWVIPAIVLGAFYYGYTQHSGEDFRKMLYAWVLPNSIVAALLSMVAGAKPLTVLVALVASPITSLNPTIGAGMVAGLCEAWLRRPTVHDCEHVSDDIMTLRGVYRNRFTRVLLVAVMSNIGSALGAWIGASWVVSLL
jgi:pheromone shutdown-related protein TraB